MSHKKENNIDAIETVIAVLKSGNRVELTATGYSMFPALRHGDRVTVEPIINNEQLKPGSIIVYRDNSGLIIHRIMETLHNSSGESVIITRGDSMKENDSPLVINQVIGMAAGYRRGNNKERLIRNIVINGLRYRFNRLILWLYFRIKKWGIGLEKSYSYQNRKFNTTR